MMVFVNFIWLYWSQCWKYSSQKTLIFVTKKKQLRAGELTTAFYTMELDKVSVYI